jgi:hypothetical protein
MVAYTTDCLFTSSPYVAIIRAMIVDAVEDV